MKKVVLSGLISFVFIFCFLSIFNFSYAKEKKHKEEDKIIDVDIKVVEVIFPEKVYFKQATNVTIVLNNDSRFNIEGCMFKVEVNDGSMVNQAVPLPARAPQKVEIKWFPQLKGQVKFKVTLTLPARMKAHKKEDIRFTKSVEVLEFPGQPAPAAP